MSAEEAIDRYVQHLTGDTYRATRMLSLVRSVSTVFSSMHWTLVNFRKPRLATSDHPVVVWPLDRGHERPRPNDLNAGVIDTLETFVPLGPSFLLLMTWLNDADPLVAIGGEGQHIATANSFVIANADAQWFHEPDAHPWVANGARKPLSADLIANYDWRVAEHSSRRHEAAKQCEAVVEAGLSNEPLPIVTVSRPG
jgi:hypothetical protein